MRFRPCIDIHDGSVKQIVGSTLTDSSAVENFISEKDAGYYAGMYRDDKLKGGHIIILNKVGTPEYEASKKQALKALTTFPGGMQIGGGITADNAKEFIEMGASHVIVTSYVFKDGKVNEDNLKALVAAVGKEHVVLDLSCKKKDDKYVITTDRWQKETSVEISRDNLSYFAQYADEFLIHAVDVEGKQNGIEEDLVRILAEFSEIQITYAGGVRSMGDLDRMEELGAGRIDVTIGSALDIFGGKLSYKEVAKRTS